MMMKKRTTIMLSVCLCLSLLFSGLASAHTVTTKSGAADLRIALSNALGEHAILAVLTMQKGLDGSKDFAASAAALDNNSAMLQQAIASVYGTAAGETFRKSWNAHIGFFVDYVKATGAKDEGAKAKALQELDGYSKASAEFFSTANPYLDKASLEAGLKQHISQLVMSFDAYANKDYTNAYKYLRDAYMHMQHFGQILADAIAKQYPDKFIAGTTSMKSIELRAALNGLLGEHALLAVNAMQNGIDGSGDYDASAAALIQNGKEISAAIGSVYGSEAGDTFGKVWTSHIINFVSYVVATAKKDEAGRQQALKDLDGYVAGSAKFLSTANPNLPEAALTDGLHTHIDQLISAFDNYANGNYTAAYASAHEAYGHMGMFADILSGAIVMQFQNNFHDADTTTPAPMPVPQTTVVKLKAGQAKLWVGSSTVALDVAPFVWNSRTYVSLRALGETVGATVSYKAADHTVHVMTGGHEAIFWINNTAMTMDGTKMNTGSKVIIRDGRTQVPLRFIAELLGWTVGWDGQGAITLSKTEMINASIDMTLMD